MEGTNGRHAFVQIAPRIHLASSSVPVSTRGTNPKLTSERIRIVSLIMICTSVIVNHDALQHNQRCGRNRFYLALDGINA